jgi:cobyrinic acid a,c-diamide synthase
MYLMRSITDQTGREFPMAGVFDFSCAAQDRHQALGYREVEFTTSTFLEAASGKARGHEFHYSRQLGADPAAVEVYRALDRAGQARSDGYLKYNCLGSYTHLHFGSNPDLAPRFVEACRT